MTFRNNPPNPMATILSAAVVGIIFWSVCPVTAPRLVCLFFAVMSVYLLFIFYCRWNDHKRRSDTIPLLVRLCNFGATMSFLTAIAVFFALWSTLKLDLYPREHIVHKASRDFVPLVADAVVVDMPQLRRPRATSFTPPLEQESTTTFIAEVKRIRNGFDWERASGRILVAVDGDFTRLTTGVPIRLKGRFSRILPPSNPYDWNREFSWRTRRVLVRLSVASSDGIEILKEESEVSIFRLFDACRKMASETFDRFLTPQTSGLAKAMLLGLRSDLDDETQDIFRYTGTVHLLAISGMHLTLVAGFASLLLRGLGFARRPLVILLLAGMLFYVLLTDMKPPVLRAMAVLVAYCLGSLIRRQGQGMNALCAAGLFILLISPGELFQFGTQLSFLATGVLIYRSPLRLGISDESAHEEEGRAQSRAERRLVLARLLRAQSGWRGRLYRVREQGTGLLKLNCLIWLVLVPLILLYTNLFTPVAMLINPLLWLPMTLGLVSGFALMIAGWLCPILCPVFATGVEFGFNFLLWLLHAAQNVPYGYCFLPGLPAWWCLVFYTGLIIFALYPSVRPRRSVVIALMLIWLTAGMSSYFVTGHMRARHKEATVEVLAVGHGQAILITTPDGRNMLYDCGSFSQGDRAGELAAQALWRQGRLSLDLLVLSHADSDHYNGCGELFRRVRVRQVLVTPYMFRKKHENLDLLEALLKEFEIPVANVVRGDTFAAWNFPQCTVLHPEIDRESDVDPEDSNAVSMVVHFQHETHRVLLTGDLNSSEVHFLHRPTPPLTALFVPHHGGKSLNLNSLLEWGRPRSLMICDGTLVRDEAARAALRRQSSCPVFSTLEDGWFRLIMNDRGSRIQTFRRPRTNTIIPE
ncbi:MAG: ComEC/Rec2 family competence protein [Planctomycetia bacterium]|nr:ComEC/Rec2 family competence protein [Planctomycetia bacterium]